MAFERIYGHEKQKILIYSFMEKGTIPQAFLFSGQEGIGKKRFGLEIAKFLLCEKKNGCNLCRGCRNVEKGVHPDLFILGKEDISTGIEESRLLKREVHIQPLEAERRVIIIDNAEMMTEEAFNALLKTLEEPPPFNSFILISSAEWILPPTIRSRCVRVYFNPLKRKEIEAYLKEEMKLEEKKAEFISSISFGSIGLSLFWLDEYNFFLRKRLAETLLRKETDHTEITLLSEKISEKKRGMIYFLFFLLSLFRDLFMINETGDTSSVINTDILSLLTSRKLKTESVVHCLREIEKSENFLFYNINRWLFFEHLLLRLRREL